MAYKCKICGYKFKAGDGSLCPECFTAREEELSFDTSRKSEELWSSRSKEKLGSFLADEMRQELHEDISMKKSLDREDAAKTRSFTEQGAHVKNESFKQAYQERRSRDTSNRGRVYTSPEALKPASQANRSSAANSFLDSIDPTLRSRITGVDTPDQSTFRYSHHTSNTDYTSNQQMQYGINGGKMPGANSYGANNSFSSFQGRSSQQRYAKGSNSKAVGVVIICVVIFILIINAFEEIADYSEEKKQEASSSNSISAVDVSKINPKIDLPLQQELVADYGEYKIKLTNYQYGDKKIDPKKKEANDKSYPSSEWDMSKEKFTELMFEFTITGEQGAELPNADTLVLYAFNKDGEVCWCNGYDCIVTASNDKNGEYIMLVTFLVPESANEFDCNIYFSSSKVKDGFASFQKFTTDMIDKQNGKKNDGSSDSAK